MTEQKFILQPFGIELKKIDLENNSDKWNAKNYPEPGFYLVGSKDSEGTPRDLIIVFESGLDASYQPFNLGHANYFKIEPAPIPEPVSPEPKPEPTPVSTGVSEEFVLRLMAISKGEKYLETIKG